MFKINKIKKNKIRLIFLGLVLIFIFLGGLLFFNEIKNLGHLFDIFYKKPQSKTIYRAENTVQIIEGWTNQDIANYFEKNSQWRATDVLRIINSASSTSVYAKEFDFLNQKTATKNLEGYLFPDTYRIYASSTVDDLVIKMLDNFNHKLTAQMREDIKAQGKTISQIVIMASIIEKEAPFNGDNNETKIRAAKIVSGIFWNRINNHQALQSDATLSYVFQDKKSSHEGSELNNSSLYNTYKYRGLPPGPICNPGLLSLEAAIYPTDSNYNYFLTASDGRIYYAKTYEEHLKNKNKYLK